MTRTVDSYQSSFLRERRSDESIRRRDHLEARGLEYRLERTPYYSTFMQHHLSRQIDSRNHKPMISDYETVLAEKKVHHPININNQMIEIVRTLECGHTSERDAAYLLFRWIVDTIAYDFGKKKMIDQSEGKPIPYRSAVQTFQEKKGVCGEMANLNVAMARIAKMKSNYVSVRQLEDGSRAVHACALIYLDGKTVLSDPAMKQFDIHHRQYEIVPDIELEQKMRAWNNGAA